MITMVNFDQPFSWMHLISPNPFPPVLITQFLVGGSTTWTEALLTEAGGPGTRRMGTP